MTTATISAHADYPPDFVDTSRPGQVEHRTEAEAHSLEAAFAQVDAAWRGVAIGVALAAIEAAPARPARRASSSSATAGADPGAGGRQRPARVFSPSGWHAFVDSRGLDTWDACDQLADLHGAGHVRTISRDGSAATVHGNAEVAAVFAIHEDKYDRPVRVLLAAPDGSTTWRIGVEISNPHYVALRGSAYLRKVSAVVIGADWQRVFLLYRSSLEVPADEAEHLAWRLARQIGDLATATGAVPIAGTGHSERPDDYPPRARWRYLNTRRAPLTPAELYALSGGPVLRLASLRGAA